MNITRFPRSALRYVGNLLLALSVRIPSSTNSHVDVLERHGNWVTCRVGEFIWRLDSTQYLDNQILQYGIFEAATTKWVRQIVKPGMVVADVGANFGYYTIQLSKLVGPKGKVYAFEPSSRFRKRLIDHLERNQCANVLVADCGLTESTQVRELYYGDSSATLLSMGGKVLDTEMVQLRRLDDYVAERKIERIDFMKVDIDGYESHFVEGAEQTLRKFSPIIIMEFSHLHLLTAGGGVEQLANQLKALGYVLCSERIGKPYMSRTEFLVEAMNCDHSVNIICFPAN